MGKVETTIMTLTSSVSNNEILLESWKRPSLLFTKYSWGQLEINFHIGILNKFPRVIATQVLAVGSTLMMAGDESHTFSLEL